MRWLKTVAPAAVDAARVRLQAGTDATIRTGAVRVSDLARQSLAPGMRGLPIGAVWRATARGPTQTIGIALQRDGRLALTVREPGNSVQRWIVLEDGS